MSNTNKYDPGHRGEMLWILFVMLFLFTGGYIATVMRPEHTEHGWGSADTSRDAGAVAGAAPLSATEPPCSDFDELCLEACSGIALSYLRHVSHGCMCGGSGVIRFVGFEPVALPEHWSAVGLGEGVE